MPVRPLPAVLQSAAPALAVPIIDCDTLDVRDSRNRHSGIDAPESG